MLSLLFRTIVFNELKNVRVRLLSSQEQLNFYSAQCSHVCACISIEQYKKNNTNKNSWWGETKEEEKKNAWKECVSIHLNMSILSPLLLLPGIFIDACMLCSDVAPTFNMCSFTIYLKTTIECDGINMLSLLKVQIFSSILQILVINLKRNFHQLTTNWY